MLLNGEFLTTVFHKYDIFDTVLLFGRRQIQII
jgi:hypothetical protein